jgi:hypothetical protein
MIALLLACRAPDVAAVATEPTMTATVRAAKVGKDQPVGLTLDGNAPQGWTIDPGAPSSEGLSVTAADPVQNGSHTYQQFTLTGPAGSYVINVSPGHAAGPEGTAKDLPMAPLFVDIGVEGLTGGPIADLLPTPPERHIPWGWIGAGLGAAALLGAGVYAWRRSRPPLPPPPPDPAHVVAVDLAEGDHLCDARVVDERVEATVTRSHLVERAFHIGATCDIRDDGGDVGVLRSGLIERLLRTPGDDDLRACPREVESGGGADAGASTRDEDDVVSEREREHG